MKMLLLILASVLISMAKEECKYIEGIASWYGEKFHGRKKANGEIFNMYKYTAASKIFPLDSYVLVKNLENSKEVVVRITDRGPLKKGRIIDLSKSSAEKLGFVKKGLVKVRVIPLHCVVDEETDHIADIIKTF